jgi:hypothetical protein
VPKKKKRMPVPIPRALPDRSGHAAARSMIDPAPAARSGRPDLISAMARAGQEVPQAAPRAVRADQHRRPAAMSRHNCELILYHNNKTIGNIDTQS